ncbi:MAG TPA: 5-formyltetrahydrofolate cyclo-ligase [Verrucomicrobiae bacterium]|nr:5-formyltetrahydrofolate cyclo-ligase [Verrucomicrobiae bacterium]
MRKQLRSLVQSLKKRDLRRKSKKITALLLQSRCYQKAENLLVYVPVAGEVDTWPVLRRSLALGKKVFVPRVSAKNGSMSIYRIDDPERGWIAGCYGVLEPRAVAARRGNPSRLDMAVVPGLGFSRSGARLGRGKGHFDKFLKKAGKAVKIGLAFREQIVAKIPMAGHDVRMDKVITD